MSDNEDDNKSESTVDGTLKAVKDLVKEVPVYEDAVQPLAKQTGKSSRDSWESGKCSINSSKRVSMGR